MTFLKKNNIFEGGDEMKEEKNSYLEVLASRLKTARNAKGMTIEQLANQIGVQKQTLNYVELNKRGRGLTISNLIKVADTLEVTTDYLLGRIDDLYDVSNAIDNSEDWHNDTLGLRDKVINEIEMQQLPYDLNQYILVTYITDNVLRIVLSTIKTKVMNKEELNKNEMQKLCILSEYLKYIMRQETECYQYLDFLISKQTQYSYNTINIEIERLRQYNHNKDMAINFEDLSMFQELLTKMEKMFSITIDEKFKNAKDEMIKKIVKNNMYYREISKYFTETNKDL